MEDASLHSYNYVERGEILTGYLTAEEGTEYATIFYFKVPKLG